MIWNVVDSRTRRYRWLNIKAIIEPTWHDNKCKDSDQADPWRDEIDYDERPNISVNDAVKWANDLPFPVTLYLMDNEGNMERGL